MNYRNIYIRIIRKAQSENRKKFEGFYYENHHILPKSLFPLWKNKKSNLVLLTAREHFFCHQLLVKIYPCKEMYCSLLFFCNNKKQGKCIVKGSREYEKIKNDFIKNVLNIKWTDKYKKQQSEQQKKIWTNERREQWKKESIERYKKRLENNPDVAKKIEIRKLVKILGKYRNKLQKEENRKIRKDYYKSVSEERKKESRKKMSESHKMKCMCVETGEVFNSIQDVADYLNVRHSNVSRVLMGKKHSIHGLHFKYFDKVV